MESSDGSKQPLICSHGEKDLGVLVDAKLKSDFHAQSVVASANQTLGLITKNILPQISSCDHQAVKGPDQTKLEFRMCIAVPVNKGDRSILESLQQCANKCIKGFQHLPYPTQLHKLKLPSLTYRHRQGDVLMTYKLVSDKSVIPNLFMIASSPGTRGHPLKLYQKRANTRLQNKFFSNCVVNL